eukprot:TRINITY_DN111418_c0_g1_i1.p1 TRINITY_DN111418_c0_g1~~TRINITY_DN111418_c0_g1_i1.p1  ORF type:complete len:595 (+),score=76.06 TRINITY_DN111418_c0_g1_i1:149-1933(+)
MRRLSLVICICSSIPASVVVAVGSQASTESSGLDSQDHRILLRREGRDVTNEGLRLLDAAARQAVQQKAARPAEEAVHTASLAAGSGPHFSHFNQTSSPAAGGGVRDGIELVLGWAFPSRSRLRQARALAQTSGQQLPPPRSKHGSGLVEVLKHVPWKADVARQEVARDVSAGNFFFLSLVATLAVLVVCSTSVASLLPKEVLHADAVVSQMAVDSPNPMMQRRRTFSQRQDEAAQGAALFAARGRPCWLVVVVVVTCLLSLLVFGLTFAKALATNISLLSHPEARKTSHEGQEVTLQAIRCPGERAFEAGVGLALSMGCGCFVLLYWRACDSVRVRAALLGLIALRGASVAILAAALLELATLTALPTDDLNDGLDVRNVLLMLSVGVSEELAKAFALLVGATFLSSHVVCITVEDVPQGVLACCGRCWRLLLESPHALMLGGLACGFGFMTMENGLYLIEVASSPPVSFDPGGTMTAEDHFIMRSLRLLTIAVRIVLNLHPWLTGISAARIARLVFVANAAGAPEGRAPADAIRMPAFCGALLPAMALHVCYDLIVITAPGMVALAAPIAFFFGAKTLFSRDWHKQRSLQHG